MQITKKTDPQTYDAIMFCIKARGTSSEYAGQYTELTWFCVKKGRLITTDAHRIHLTRVNLPDDVYAYSKTKGTITLKPITSKELEQNTHYPDVTVAIPKTFAHTITVQRKDFLRRCKQANVIKFDNYQGLTLTFNGRLDIRIINPDIGTMDAHVDTDHLVDPEIVIGMSIRYLIDALTGLKGKEITIGLNDETMPLILRNKTQAALIMPIRV